MRYEAHPLRGDEDRRAVVQLWREGLSDERIAEVIDDRLRWLYELNPAGPATTWIVADGQSGDVAGCASVYPRRVWLSGREVTAGVLCDFAVAKAHRVAGPAVTLQRAMARASLEHGYEFLYGYPNDKALPIFKRIGFTMVGDSTVWVKPLRTAYKLREHVPSAVAWAAGLLGDRLLDANDLRQLVGRSRRFRDELREHADGDFDELWARSRARLPLAGERSAAYLSWRYEGHLTEQYRYFCLYDRNGGGLRGYVAFREREQKIFVVDAFWDAPELVEVLVLRFAREMRSRGADSICVIYAGDAALLERLEQLLFFKREGTRKLVGYVDKKQPAALRDAVADERNWSMFDGELDI